MTRMFLLMVAVLSTFNMYNRSALAQVSIVTHEGGITGASLVLECQVTSFGIGAATWSNDYGVTVLTRCFSAAAVCSTTGIGTNYNYTSDTNGINVTIAELTSSEQGKTWTCSYKTYNDSYTVPKASSISKDKTAESVGVGVGSEAAITFIDSSVIGAISLCTCITSLCTILVASNWYFSQKYVFLGRVVFGIQIVIVAAFVQVSIIIIAAIVLPSYEVQYTGQYDKSVTMSVILSLLCFFPGLGVVIFIAIMVRCNRGGKKLVTIATQWESRKQKPVTTQHDSSINSLMENQNDSSDYSPAVSKCCPPSGKTLLLILIVVLPFAWFVLLLLICKNYKDCCGSGDVEKENQNKDEGNGKPDKNKDEEKGKSDKHKHEEHGTPDKNKNAEKGKPDTNKDEGNGKPDKNKNAEKGKPDTNKDEGKGKPDKNEDEGNEKPDVKDVKKEAGNHEQGTTDIGKQNVWANTPNGRQLPSLPEIGTRNDEKIDPAQKGNKKKKRNNKKNAVSNDDSAQYTDIGTD